MRINMQDSPVVSIVIPLYNKGTYIERTLNSVLAQTIQDFEVIVVDDGSTDNGANVVSEYHNTKIRLIRQNNQGESAARNRGVAEAHSELIAFIDADDEWRPQFLETIIRLQKKNPLAGIYCTAYDMMRPNGIITRAVIVTVPPPPWEGVLSRYFLSAALGGPTVSSSSCAITKKIFDEFNGFLVNCRYGPDTDLWGRIALKYPVMFSWYIGAIYHEDASNRVCNENFPIDAHPFLKFADEAIKNNEISEEVLPDLNEYIAALQISIAARNICLGRPYLGRFFLKKCNTNIFNYQKYFWIILTYVPPKILLWIRKIKCNILK